MRRLRPVVCLAAALAAGGADAPQPNKETVVFKRVGSLAIEADLYRPDGLGPHPVILCIHGGALIFGDRNMIPEEQRQLYLQEGFSVFSIDYRLAPETKLDLLFEDIESAHQWLLTNGREKGLDPDRMAVIGHSAGGYLALLAGARFNPRARAVVSFYGYGDIAGDWYSRPDPFYLTTPSISEAEAWKAVGSEPLTQGDEGRRFDFYRFCRQKGLWPRVVTGHDPMLEPREFDRLCPIRLVSPQFPPTMLIHGEKDSDVPVSQSRTMAAALTKEGVECRLRTLPGREHVFDLEEKGIRDPGTTAVFREVIGFLREKLKN